MMERPSVLNLQTFERLEGLGPQSRTVGSENCDVLPQGIKRNTAYLQPHFYIHSHAWKIVSPRLTVSVIAKVAQRRRLHCLGILFGE